tara:strand:+ start:325 stop:507 length:183 start_codon:yes stop_codon:yes gene_type:complete
MYDILNGNEILLSVKSLILGILVGGIFAVFGLKPPSPDSLIGICGIVGIFCGWVLLSNLF